MKTTQAWIGLVVLLVGVPVPGGGSPWDDYTKLLKGLEGCRIHLETFLPNAEAGGFDQETFETKLAGKFYMAGIEMLSAEQWQRRPGEPLCYANVGTLATATRRSAPFGVHISVREWVTVYRTGEVTLATTWELPGIFGVGDADQVLQVFDQQLDMFLDAWRKANPKNEPQEAPETP